MTNTLKNVRNGYRIYSQVSSVIDSGDTTYRRSNRKEYPPVITIEEIGRVMEQLGERAADVYAKAVELESFQKGLARDLVKIGPWSWSPEVWYSDDAEEIYPNDMPY